MHQVHSKLPRLINRLPPLISLVGLVLLMFTTGVWAEQLLVQVSNNKGAPIQDVVVMLYSTGKVLPKQEPQSVSITQIDQEFVPPIRVVPVGSMVSFPNQDDILHHVYSFSKAKTFDLPLYKGVPNEPVRFDMPGVVALGCNIHDWMSAHVLVVDTPFYQQTGADGVALFSGLERGEYRLELWHPRQRKEYVESITLGEQKLEHAAVLRLKPSFRTRRRNSGAAEQY